MSLLPLLGTAGAAASAAYVDAKFYLSKDIGHLLNIRKGFKAWDAAVRDKRASHFYQFEASASVCPDAPCIWSRQGCFTWRQALKRIYQYGQYFLSLGCTPGTFVGVYLKNGPEFLLILLGLHSIGCAPSLLNYSLSSDALVHAARLGTFKYMLADSEDSCLERVNTERERLEAHGVSIIPFSKELVADIALRDPIRPDDANRETSSGTLPLAVLYTSGTTGLPKAFRSPMQRTYVHTVMLPSAYGVKPGPDGDVWYVCMPLYHGSGLFSALSCLCAGVQVAVGRSFSLHGFWPDARDSGATVFTYVGEAVRYLLSNPPAPDDREHRMRLAWGNGMQGDTWQKFQERFGVPEIQEFYASTEGLFSCRTWSRNGHGTGSVGHTGVLMNFLFRKSFVLVALDPETNDIWRSPETGFARQNKASEGGEMLIKLSDQLSWQGYEGDEEATEKKVARDVFDKGDTYQRTGDALRRDSDGFWYFLDRLGDTYRWKGHNVSTTEVMACVAQFPGVQAANVYGVQLPHHDGRAGCAAIAIAPAHRASFDWAALLRHLQAKLPPYAVPIFVRVVERDLVSMGIHNNKPDTARLRAEGVDPALLGSKVPGGETDRLLWLPGKDASMYVPFLQEEWEKLLQNGAKL